MKRFILVVALSFLVAQLFAQNYTASDEGSEVKFTIKNFGVNVNGRFKNLKGKMTFNPASPGSASVSTSVDAATVNTGSDSRDNHLRKQEYFDVQKFPQISFVSTKIGVAANSGTFSMEGKLTIKGVTKAVSFPFTATPAGDGYLLKGEIKLNRRDFGVGGSSLVMSDNLTVFLSVLAKK